MEINWTAVGVAWAVVTTVIQVIGVFVLFLMRKQADEFKKEAATTTAIGQVQANLELKIDTSQKRVRQEIDNAHGEVKRELEKLEGGDRHLERRVTVLEQAVAYAPKAQDLADLRMQITALATNVARFEGVQTENNRVLRLMHEFLLEKGR